jgi:magnesium chelatase subunit D
MKTSNIFPFAAVVGQEQLKRALLLLAVDAGLKGVLIAAKAGTAKTTLARALQAITARSTPFIQLPLNVTEDRLLGGLDIEKTLAAGKPNFSIGLLAQAHEGLLFVDEVNLLDQGIANIIAAALEQGAVRIEREGLSATHPAEFSLIAAYDPAEGEPPPSLLDRVGLISVTHCLVQAQAVDDADERAEIISRAERFERDPEGFIRSYEMETIALSSRVERAKKLLPAVRISKQDITRLCLAALRLGVASNRADIFAARAARASAALDERRSVEEQDLISAIRLTLLPRATIMPASETQRVTLSSASTAQQCVTSSRQQNSQEICRAAADLSGRSSGHIQEICRAAADLSGSTQELLSKALDAHLPYEWLATRPAKGQSGQASSGAVCNTYSGRSNLATNAVCDAYSVRGRYVRSVAHPIPAHKRIATDATLRAAAPFQRARRETGSQSQLQVIIKPDDLRFKQLKRREGTLFIFAVDASGSMAMNRMAQAKGAMLRLLEKVYLHRDSVSLISFRGKSAHILLEPTRSVELARRLLEALPAGGSTPIAAGLVCALELAKRARRLSGAHCRLARQVVLAIFTDGRANVGLHTEAITDSGARAAAMQAELKQLGVALKSKGIATVVIDTKPRFVSGGGAQALAELLGARYLYLPRADADMISDELSQVAAHSMMR